MPHNCILLVDTYDTLQGVKNAIKVGKTLRAKGGLGDVAVRYGYQRFDVNIMLITIAIMVILVQAIQWIGDKLAKWMAHGRH